MIKIGTIQYINVLMKNKNIQKLFLIILLKIGVYSFYLFEIDQVLV